MTHNLYIGSSAKSFHPLGLAADIHPVGITPLRLMSFVSDVPDFACGGVGFYATFLHLDVRKSGKCRW
jgi:uncharacterized protein YcbK (DUF882 family)